MILVKGFLKHKSSKIYLIIFTFLLLTISVIFSFSQYYSDLITKSYQKNSYFFVVSKDEIYNKLKKEKNIAHIEKVAILNPDNITFPKEHNVNSISLLDQGNSYIIVKPNQNKKDILEDNQINIELSKFMLDSVSALSKISGETIFFQFDNSRVKFNISNVRESDFARVTVSPKNFEQFLKNNPFYSYTFILNDYNEKDKIINYLENQENVEHTFIEIYESDAQFNTVKSFEQTFNLLSHSCIVIAFVFLCLFLIITYNIVNDELERMKLERMLGYNKWQIKKFLIMKMVILNLIMAIFYIISSICINFLLSEIFKISLNLFNFNAIYILLVLSLISIILSFLCKIRTIKLK